MARYDEARSTLNQRLHQLTHRIERIEGDLRRVPSPDSGERAVELENDEVLQQLDQGSRAEVQQIRAALGRLDSDSYGVCVACGGAIGSARLAAIPTAATCRVCAV
jgi:DnaK suppressor protein